MSTKTLLTGFAIFLILFTAGLWYSQTRAYYYDVNGLESVEINGRPVAVTDYRGIDADTSPIKMRACFTLIGDLPADVAETTEAEPLIAPPQFDCFDARRIETDLHDGTARALLAARNQPYGIDRIIALYPDNRAYMWRMINECGKATFDGEEPPASCPPKPDSE